MITAITIPGDNEPSKYEIHATGTDDCKIRTILGSQEVKWQISFPSEEVQQKWLVSLRVACNFAVNWPKRDEIDRLKDLARKMRSNVDARMRFHRFKLFSRCFVGRRAVRWIVKYEGCTPNEACIVGQKMLNLGLFQHITNEHVFCNKKLFYQFPSSFDHLTAPRDSGLFPQTSPRRAAVAEKEREKGEGGDRERGERGEEEVQEDERGLLRKLSMGNEDLVQVRYSPPFLFLFILISALTADTSQVFFITSSVLLVSLLRVTRIHYAEMNMNSFLLAVSLR